MEGRLSEKRMKATLPRKMVGPPGPRSGMVAREEGASVKSRPRSTLTAIVSAEGQGDEEMFHSEDRGRVGKMF